MGCIYTSNNNKSRITIRVMELKQLSYQRDPSSFAVIEGQRQPVISRHRCLEATRHMQSSRVRGARHFTSSMWKELTTHLLCANERTIRVALKITIRTKLCRIYLTVEDQDIHKFYRKLDSCPIKKHCEKAFNKRVSRVFYVI